MVRRRIKSSPCPVETDPIRRESLGPTAANTPVSSVQAEDEGIVMPPEMVDKHA